LRDRARRVEAVLAEQRVDALKPERAAADDRKGVGKGIALAPRCAPLAMRAFEQVEIVWAVHPQQRLLALIARRLCGADRLEDRIDAAGVLGRRVHRAVEELARGPMPALPLVPQAAHQCGAAICTFELGFQPNASSMTKKPTR
jgi:hypothetical protein